MAFARIICYVCVCVSELQRRQRSLPGYAPPARSMLAGYVFATIAVAAALAISYVLDVVTGSRPSYVLLVGAVAVTVWYGGFKSGLVTVVLGWTITMLLLVVPAEADARGNEIVRWTTSLGVAFAVVWVSYVMHRRHARAATAADVAEATAAEMERLQELASALSSALTPLDVARALTERTPALLRARGGAVGLLEGDELLIVGPLDVATQTHRPGTRLALTTRAPIVRAASTGRPVLVRHRATFDAEYPDGVSLSPYARGAVALPLRAGGEVVGSMSFLFDREGAIEDDAIAIAQIVANLAEQAFERARLYEIEHASREALDRILRVAPRFHADTAEAVSDAICGEARRSFGADLATLWRLRDSRLELVRSDPEHAELEPGLTVELEDFPELEDAVARQQVSFVPDVQAEARGPGLERVRALEIHSSLRTPIVIGEHAELVLIVSWQARISAPDALTTVLARRFADQAGLALEQLERRRAEAEAARRADETRRLQEVTAALSLAATATDVSDVCLEHALEAVGADAGLVVLTTGQGVAVELVTSRGYDEPALEVWRSFDLEGEAPFAQAIATGESLWVSTEAEVRRFAPALDLGDVSWATIPIRSSDGPLGALHLAFRTARTLSDGERRWLQTVVSQCSQALERSRLFDEEQRMRLRSERLQSMTAALSNALTRQDVATVVVEEVAGAVGAAGTAVAVVLEDRQSVRTLAWDGYAEEVVGPLLEVPLDEPTPGNRAIRRGRSYFYESLDELRVEFPEAALDLEVLGHSSYLFIPLVAGRRTNGLLITSWEEQRALSDEDRRFVESLAAQAAQALDRATAFESERTIAETLQQSVLPASLPRVDGLELAARYLPGTAGLDVGGDWFDAVVLPDGRLGLVVGDVVGKGVHAAASMGQLRNALRAFTLDRMKPAATLARLNRLAEDVLDTAFATIVYAVVDRKARMCRFTSAGHPPPLVVYPDGRAELLEGGRGLPLGAGPTTPYEHDVVELPVGSLLVLYTDGLVERRGVSIDAGLERLRAVVREGPRQPEALVEHILAHVVGSGERRDDIALLAVRLHAIAPEPFDLRVPSAPASLDVVRDALRAWLEGAPVGHQDAYDVVLAAWEACANAVEHAHATDDDRHVVVSARLDDARITLVVEDSGRWVTPSVRDDRGLGLDLMRSLMSSVHVATDADGTRITLEKALASA